MIFSKIVDYYALNPINGFHRNQSKESQYTYLPTHTPKVMDRETFYKSHPADILFDTHYSITNNELANYKKGTFQFKSLIPSGDSTNDYLTGEVFLNTNEDAPNIIFVHGWRMTSFDRLKKIFYNRIVNEFGWNMYYFPLPYHLGRKPYKSLFSGEYMISANISRTVQSTRQAIVDLRALIQWIKVNKKGPVVLVGLSLGGFITNLTATLESQIDALISVFYCNRLSYTVWNTIPGKFIKADLERHGVTYNDLIEYWNITEPGRAAPKIDKDKILLFSAKHDQYVHIEDADLLWESWGRPTRYVYNCGHAGIVLNRKKIAMDSFSFLQNTIKG